MLCLSEKPINMISIKKKKKKCWIKKFKPDKHFIYMKKQLFFAGIKKVKLVLRFKVSSQNAH